MEAVVIKVERGVAEVAYSSEKVNVIIVSDDSNDLFTYKESIVKITGINDDGTVDVAIVSASDGHAGSRRIINVPVADLEWYADDDEDLYLEDD